MKKLWRNFPLCLAALALSACGTGGAETSSPPLSGASGTSSWEGAATTQEPAEAAMHIRVQAGDRSVIYQLNDSPAAAALYAQLPLTTQVEDFSTNEKIFYPPQELDTDNCPLAAGGSGTLAYYQPWGDVVMFYGNYSENPSLFELGHVISGEELISRLSGTITIDIYQEVQR